MGSICPIDRTDRRWLLWAVNTTGTLLKEYTGLFICVTFPLILPKLILLHVDSDREEGRQYQMKLNKMHDCL